LRAATDSASSTIPAEIFTIYQVPWLAVPLVTCGAKPKEQSSSESKPAPRDSPAAQGLHHMAVDDVHPIDFSTDKSAFSILTSAMKGVKRNSFFDSF
jgi:hypothetical protein